MSSRVSGARIESFIIAPPESLRTVVECFWITRWDLREQPSHVVELLADPCLNIAFEKARSRVVGVSTKLFQRELCEMGLIRAVKLRAGAARAVFAHTSISRLSNRVLSAESLLANVAEIESTVLSEPEDERAVQLFQTWLLAQLDSAVDAKISLATRAVERMSQSPMATSVSQIADEMRMDVRQLQRLFRDYVGASPKWTLSRFRLQHAAQRIELGAIASLAELAAELGYSDHAHLTRDFKDATGKSPKEFARTVWE